jgi:hypothetical protein
MSQKRQHPMLVRRALSALEAKLVQSLVVSSEFPLHASLELAASVPSNGLVKVCSALVKILGKAPQVLWRETVATMLALLNGCQNARLRRIHEIGTAQRNVERMHPSQAAPELSSRVVGTPSKPGQLIK